MLKSENWLERNNQKELKIIKVFSQLLKSLEKMGHIQKLAINEKSSISVLFFQNLVKMETKWDSYFYQVLWE